MAVVKTEKLKVRTARKRIGDILVEAGLITREQMKAALQKQAVSGKRIGNLLVEMGFLSEENMVGALSRQLEIPSIDLKKITVPDEVLNRLPFGFLMKHQVVPVAQEDRILKIAMADPLDRPAISDIEFMIGGAVHPMVATPTAVEQFLERIGDAGRAERPPESAEEGIEVIEEKKDRVDASTLRDASRSPAIVRAVNKILADGIRSGAATIHIKPRQNDVLIRYRIDGVLRNATALTTPACAALLARLKTMGRMRLSEEPLFQTGSLTVRTRDQEVDLRLSTMPTVYGEKMVVRIIGKTQKIRSLENLGMHPKDLSSLYSMLAVPHGLFILAGPIGSGITTTLYTALRHLRSEELSIVTLENPIEQQIPGINQVQVGGNDTIDFKAGLRAALYQDPDIIMVSELRDSGTAQIVFQSALMGYLVLSALYTNNVVSALTHLLHFDVRPHIAASALSGIVSQRLVRRNCVHCLERYVPEPRVFASLNIDVMEVSKTQFYRGKGCPKCAGTGYSGQIGLFEILPVDYTIRDMILKKASERELLLKAQEKGMTTMEENGLYLVLNKITTLEEVMRVIPSDEITVRRTGNWAREIVALFDEAMYLL